jgi:prevent-host-death family protein
MAKRNVRLEVGISEFRDNMREWLDVVRSGDDVILTDRGRPVARLIPAGALPPYERLVAEGIITPARQPRRRDSAYRRVKPRGSVSDLVKEQRR